MKCFEKIRPQDINLEIPISDKTVALTYYMFSTSFYNTFSEGNAISCDDTLIGKKELKTKKLSEILDKYVKKDVEIDFLSVDVEGMDVSVLKSNNWSKYRPKVVVVEYHATAIENIKESEINNFLNDKGYLFYCGSSPNLSAKS